MKKTDESPYHGDYLQGRRPKQYEGSAICLGYALGFLIVMIAVFGVYKIAEFLIQFIKAL